MKQARRIVALASGRNPASAPTSVHAVLNNVYARASLARCRPVPFGVASPYSRAANRAFALQQELNRKDQVTDGTRRA